MRRGLVARRIQPEALSAPKRPSGNARNAASRITNPPNLPPDNPASHPRAFPPSFPRHEIRPPANCRTHAASDAAPGPAQRALSRHRLARRFPPRPRPALRFGNYVRLWILYSLLSIILFWRFRHATTLCAHQPITPATCPDYVRTWPDGRIIAGSLYAHIPSLGPILSS
jgi:hypothetical protein